MKAQPDTEKQKNLQNELSKSDSPKKRRAWGARRRLVQRQHIYKVRPWLRACGPRSVAGLRISAQNARKSGVHYARHQFLRRVLWLQSAFLKQVRLARYRASPQLMREANRVTAQLLLACHLLGALSERHES